MNSLPCSCLIPCGCAANFIADELHCSPLYHQRERERWNRASEIYEELHGERPKLGLRQKSRSECHSPTERRTNREWRNRLDQTLASLTTSSPSVNKLDMMTTDPIPCLRCGNQGGSPPFGSLPMSLHKVGSLNRSLAGSITSSRGDSGCSSLELEAVAAMHELSFAVQSICVSEMLPRTSDLLFVNVTTTEGQPYCLELTLKGWRVTSLRSDCMIGDFTKLEMFVKYYDSLYALLDDISPGYRQRFGERVAKKLMMLQNEDSSDLLAPSSSYCSPPFSMSPSDSTESLPIITPVPSPVPEREGRQRDTIKTSGIPTDIFRMKDLKIIDFSNNQLREVPNNLEYAKYAIVLNLSHNNIENIPNQVFSNLTDLLYVDLSFNKLDMLPPQIRRLSLVQKLQLSNNPLHHFQLKQLPSMTSLRVLHMRNTNRTLDNIPPTLDDLENLTDVDFSENNLPSVPDALYKLKSLRKLDLSANKISKIELPEGSWESLATLNISSNCLKALPEGLVRMTVLQRLYANNNELTFEGIPSGIGRLVQLTVLHLSYNQLELVPEGLSRCVKLQRVRLDHNKLITLPDGIHLLPYLTDLDLHENDDLVMPPKPNEKRKALNFYNIDFSLANQMRLAGQSPCSSVSSMQSSSTKDPVARRKDFIRRRRHQADESGASKVIQGMSKIAGTGSQVAEDKENEEAAMIKPAANWRTDIDRRRRQIDYKEIFEDEVGNEEGIWVWEIENFYPSLMDEAFHGQFYDADAYLVLRTVQEPSGSLTHSIYFWLGEKATLDKGMCAAVHAVGLRNHLNASCRTIREEQNDESDEFLELFEEEIVYIEGARTATGFFTIKKQVPVTRLYRCHVNEDPIVEHVPENFVPERKRLYKGKETKKLRKCFHAWGKHKTTTGDA